MAMTAVLLEGQKWQKFKNASEKNMKNIHRPRKRHIKRRFRRRMPESFPVSRNGCDMTQTGMHIFSRCFKQKGVTQPVLRLQTERYRNKIVGV